MAKPLDPTGYRHWSIVERSGDRIMLRGPDGYIRLQKAPFSSSDEIRWMMTVKLGNEIVKRRSRLTIGDCEEVWSVIKDEIDRIENGYHE